MKGQRRKFTPEFKAKVVIEALKERITLAELSEKHGIAGTQISTWKSEFLKNSSQLFGSTQTIPTEESEKQKLYSKIGQLQMENDFLKKTLL